MSSATAGRPRRGLLALVHVAFACQLLFPAGYMPGAIGAGSFITLCPSGLPAGLIETADLSDAAHGEEGQHSSHDEASAWDHCALGALAATPALTSTIAVGVPSAASDSIATAELGTPALSRPLAFHARAPPRVFS